MKKGRIKPIRSSRSFEKEPISTGEKIIKSRPGWRKTSQVKKIKIIMTSVLVILFFSVAAGAALAWLQLKPAETTVNVSETAMIESSEIENVLDEEPVSLLLVNTSTPLPENYKVQLSDIMGVQVDSRILTYLQEMLQDAKKSGIELSITKGYIDKKAQDKEFQAVVSTLMTEKGMTPVKAENEALKTTVRGGCSELQTGLAVQFASVDGVASFENTKAYHWLVANCVEYGFVLRYPNNKESATNISFNPAHFRYVGVEHAKKMRELAMCLEEYAQYVKKQTKNN